MSSVQENRNAYSAAVAIPGSTRGRSTDTSIRVTDAPSTPRGVDELPGHLQEAVPHHVDPDGQVERGVEERQADQAIQQVEEVQLKEQRGQHRLERDHESQQYEAEGETRPAELEEAEAVPGERRHQGGQHGREHRDDQAVDDVADDVILAGQQRMVIRERQVAEAPARGRRTDRRLGLQGAEDSQSSGTTNTALTAMPAAR